MLAETTPGRGDAGCQRVCLGAKREVSSEEISGRSEVKGQADTWGHLGVRERDGEQGGSGQLTQRVWLIMVREAEGTSDKTERE